MRYNTFPFILQFLIILPFTRGALLTTSTTFYCSLSHYGSFSSTTGFAQTRKNRLVVLKGNFLDDLFQGNFFAANNDENSNEKKVSTSEKEEELSESAFQNEVQKRSSTSEDRSNVMTKKKEKTSSLNNNEEFDGYALRDAIYAKWGQYFDVDFQPVQSLGFKKLYLNVLPFRMGGRKFRHATEYDYLCHLQAIVEILVKYDQLDYVLMQLEETKKKPRPGTSPLIAVPFRLDLTEDELNEILA